MKQRVITAVCLLALLAVVVWQINTPIFIIVIAFFSAVASNEIMKCAKVTNKFILVAGTTLGAIVPFTSSPSVLEPWVKTESYFKVISLVPPIAWIIVVILAYFLAMLKDFKNTKFEQVSIAIFASIAVPYGFSMFPVLKNLIYAGETYQYGIYLIFYGLICALATDTGAQLGGMAFGKTKMCPNISPKKTMEGAFCGVLFSMICNVVALVLYNKLAIKPLSMLQAGILLGLAPVVSFMGMMGDLTASVLKRNFGVKDFGKIFPGHGGVMDRFDSSLFTLPLTYVIARIILTVSVG